MLDNITHLYFVGIGGIGMSALARHFNSQGLAIAGYDANKTTLTTTLETEGINIEYSQSIEHIESHFNGVEIEHCLVIYTPAISINESVFKATTTKYRSLKRAEVLAELTRGKFTIAVAGTHGKTTTTAYLAHILIESGHAVTAFLGGISSNYHSNYIHQKGSGEEILVVEADEFDRSFHKLHPNISIITSCEADHLDVYGSYEELLKAYQIFANQTEEKGELILHDKIEEDFKDSHKNVQTYGRNGHFAAQKINILSGKYQFEVSGLKTGTIVNGLPGEHNVLNCLAAIVATRDIVPPHSLQKAIKNFNGIRRRFEPILHGEPFYYFDDYAHHPTEIAAAIKTAKALFPGKKLTVVFQPHLYSRTRDFKDAFGAELKGADDLIIMPIYPAREKPTAGVSSDILVEAAGKGKIKDHDEVLAHLEQNQPEILLTLGAGSIDKLPEAIVSKFSNKKEAYG